MSGAVEVEAVRPRPLSGGLWTLFSWLRRDERFGSSDSLSSAGSDRTAASFAFLGPGHYATADPLAIPPPGPPTDSYKKRVRDRNLRRNRDRDVTLLRKYGLHGFDAFTLPNARLAGNRERDRRATSEILQRRVHVPGKRRAPLPPSAPTSLTRRRATKRPAPQPPAVIKPTTEDKVEINLENTKTLPMNSQQIPDKPLKHSEVNMGCKSEKYVKKESKEVKPRQDKSFLKQIFDNRKRHSAIDTTSVKLLPSISELDKQAHEIIEKYKLKELEHQEGKIDNNSPGSSKQQTEAWICTRCLRKYNASVITCLYCLPLENALLNNSSKSSKVTNYTQTASNSNRSSVEDKEKLKEILKEMKDSLPKIPAPGPSHLNNKSSNEDIAKRDYPKIIEAPTLRIGSSVSAAMKNLQPSPLTRKAEAYNDNKNDKPLATIDNVLVTQPVVLVHTKDNIVIVDEDKVFQRQVLPQSKPLGTPKKLENANMTKTQIASKLLSEGKRSLDASSKDKSDINTPLKVSSLFNPIYIPRSTATSIHATKSSNEQTEVKVTEIEEVKPIKTFLSHSTVNPAPSTSQNKPKLFNVLPFDEKAKLEDTKQSSSKKNDLNVKKIADTKTSVTEVAVSSIATPSNPSTKTSVVEMIDQHSRRRNLINQLEKSIADGDERAAAEAAVKLAQLKLSCSVLSFSSQIASESPASGVGKTDYRKTEEKSKISHMKFEKAAPAVALVKSNETPKHLTSGNSNRSSDIVNESKNLQENISQINVPPPLKGALSATAAIPKVGPVNKLQCEKIDKAVQNPVRCDPSTSKDNVKKDNVEDVPILVWVEDKEATRGPVQIHVGRNATLGELRRQADKSLGLAVRMQRWIIGRALCSDDSTPLVALAGPELTAPFYLCLVESETKKSVESDDAPKIDPGNVYNELVKLEQQALVPNAEVFDCGVCMEECLPGGGVILRDCVHSFCIGCLSDVVRHSQEPIVSCPAMGCRGVLQEREIRALVSGDDYEKWLARGLAMAESGTRNSFHCRTRDCTGWALCEPGVRRFPCPVCKRNNCVPCQAIHEGKTCEQHRATVETTSNEAGQTDEGTRALLDSLIARGEALECPECSAIITKKWGCDWIKCSACKTEICWVTRGRRWGPAGRGDTSAGCRCGVDGKKCHPSCGYCH